MTHDDREVTATPLVVASAAVRPRCLPLLCVVGVTAALVAAAAAAHDRRRNGDQLSPAPLERDRDFPAVTSRHDAGEFPLPVVNDIDYAVCRRDAADLSCFLLWTSKSVRRRGRLGARTTRSSPPPSP